MRHVEDATVNKYALVDIQYPTFYMEKIADRERWSHMFEQLKAYL